jgi:hypothetical protein
VQCQEWIKWINCETETRAAQDWGRVADDLGGGTVWAAETFDGGMTDGSPVRFRIVKKTAKRICHSRAYECQDERGQPDGSGPRDYRDYEDNIGFVDRQEREAKGCVYNRGRG